MFELAQRLDILAIQGLCQRRIRLEDEPLQVGGGVDAFGLGNAGRAGRRLVVIFPAGAQHARD